MLKRISNGFAILALLAFAAPVFASGFSQNLSLTRAAQIGQTTLRPGHYKVIASLKTDQVKVDHNGKLVASVRGKTVNLKYKSPYGAVVLNRRRIHEIQFAGKTQAIELPSS